VSAVRPLRAAAACALALAACGRSAAPPLPAVKVHVSSDLPGEVLRDAAQRLGVAAVRLVGRPEDAEVVWASDPAALAALGVRPAPGSAPEAAGADPRLADPARRFVPVGARARVLLVGRGASPATPARYRDLTDRRLRGRIALAHPAAGAGPVTFAALALTYGDASTRRLLGFLARNEPVVVRSDAEVREAVAAGRAGAGLAGSVEGAAGAASAAALEVVYPDQSGRGAVVLPTAAAAVAGAGPGAAALLAWLASARAEAVLVARIPGLLPLRDGVPVPVGVEPSTNLVALPLDWDALAAETARLRPVLERWPDGFDAGPGLAAPGAHP
jgi:iron(III) transport system substrate-binding protein